MNGAQTIPLGHFRFTGWVVFLTAQPHEVAVHFPLQFEVENNAAHFAAARLDPRVFLLIERDRVRLSCLASLGFTKPE